MQHGVQEIVDLLARVGRLERRNVPAAPIAAGEAYDTDGPSPLDVLGSEGSPSAPGEPGQVGVGGS